MTGADVKLECLRIAQSIEAVSVVKGKVIVLEEAKKIYEWVEKFQ